MPANVSATTLFPLKQGVNIINPLQSTKQKQNELSSIVSSMQEIMAFELSALGSINKLQRTRTQLQYQQLAPI